ncbi:MAG TPA: hypothetical protein VG273_19760 [Bryobacteraceae bacterium]|jgi:methyl-accepting chemotaxis protein|nr:hypothetical protein [Bryobacteraceae bacterium]
MYSPVALVISRLFRFLADLLLYRVARTARWVQHALPGNRIQWHRSRLDDFAAGLETRFVHVSARLENLAGESAQLLDSSRKLLKYSLGHDDASTFQAAVAIMEKPLEFNEECLGITEKLDRNLALVAVRIGRLHRFRSALDASIAPLKILQTMFRIESAASSPEIQSLFTSLSAEIERLLFSMSTMIAREFEAIERTGATVRDVIARLEGVRFLQVKAQARRSQIAESLQKLEAQIETNKEKDVRLIGATQAVAGKVAGMVAALQYQDILNQRLQHVLEGLGSLAERLQALRGNNCIAELNFVRDASKVESAHLEDVESVFGGAVETLRSSLESLAEEMGGLDRQCIRMDGVESSSAACDGMVQVLLDSIGENLELTELSSARSEEIFAVLEPIGSLLGNLTGSILELSARIRLIALNAQIQAAQAGDGSGLEVLSSQTRSIAEEIARIVTDIAAELAVLKEGLKSGLEDVEYTRFRSLEFLRFLREDGAEHEARLHGFRNRMLAELKRVGELITSVQTESRGLSASLDMPSAALSVVAEARGELLRFSDSLSVRLDGHARGSGLLQHTRAYTAAAEHAAHARALRPDSGGDAEMFPAPPVVEGSVELF